MISIPTNYDLKWSIIGYPNYMVTDKGVIINIKTYKVLRRVINGGSIGYWFGKEFKTLDSIRPLLQFVTKQCCPF